MLLEEPREVSRVGKAQRITDLIAGVASKGQHAFGFLNQAVMYQFLRRPVADSMTDLVEPAFGYADLLGVAR